MDQEQKQTRHVTLYFEDGDLELSARKAGSDDEGCLLFCVYRAQLRRVSPVFCDMLALGGDRKEVVEMPDSAEDLAALLESVFISSSFVLRLWDTDPSRSAVELSGLVRIARKYQVDDIANVVIRHISELWPKSLAEWDKTFPTWMENRKTTATSKLIPEPASAIRFANEFNVPSILPAAFYFLAVQSAENIETAEESPHCTAARWDLTEHTMLLQLIRGRDHMRSEFLRECQRDRCIVGFHGGLPATLAATRDKCNAARAEVLLTILRGGLGNPDQGHATINAYQDICCKREMTKRATNARSEMWEGLPGFFAISLTQ
ncbi:hypothetical protein PsYK624_130850 [Phanerochaete sordida]|uniref:BTB domain-containing protein n=1 Tax=Phanerochaete sordida TaxID=48140 RepID=A0A9P3GJX2_9APHY|nr:hypothetical protein PsYK624_130850 [Phanerochaete sordida]